MKDPKTITEKFKPVELARLGLLLTNFQQKNLNERYQIIDELVEAHALLSVTWGEGWRFRRARILENISANHVQDFLWPPNALASAGRANKAGQSVMYLADRIETALREIRLDEGEVVLAEFSIRPGKNLRILPIGEMVFINRTGHGRLLKEHGLALNDFMNACEHEEAQAYLITDAFLNEILSNDKDPYELSSYLCNALFKKYPDASVIAYPSAQQLGTINFAAKTENFWNSWGVASVSKFYAEHLAQGFYTLKQRTNVTGIYTSGKLQWGESKNNIRVTNPLHPLWIP
ncbi:RES family NAD+ phosphorylase [Bordetella parapertussis]|uniref:RES domain-containing protein n=1 Tax=Bordetella parapertussis (strain Bpp5) TaxID=1208660 RepID=K0MJD7_BORPB|nr:RES family NAD+ phosphorylase [Bordetella parapertussis]CCJ50999.1 Hypothetical protein BN117_3666 [Bordetella parapertussis Bpp5]